MASSNQQTADPDELASLRQSVKASEERETALREQLAGRTGEVTQLQGKLTEAQISQVRADLQSATNSIAACENEAALLEKDLVEAGTKGDFAAVAQINRKIASAQYRLEGWQQRKTQIDNWVKAQAAPAAAATKTATTTEGQSPADKATADWIAKHQDIYNNPRLWKKALAAHYNMEVEEKIAVGSPEYFQKIEEAVGLRTAATSTAANGAQVDDPLSEASDATDGVEVDTQPEPVKKKKTDDESAMAAAPAQVAPAQRNTTPRGQVRLSQSQMETARFSFPHLKPEEAYKEYAKNLVALEQEGRITRQ